jgi:hypothetical protein
MASGKPVAVQCPVNTIENIHIYLVLADKATVSTTAF